MVIKTSYQTKLLQREDKCLGIFQDFSFNKIRMLEVNNNIQNTRLVDVIYCVIYVYKSKIIYILKLFTRFEVSWCQNTVHDES